MLYEDVNDCVGASCCAAGSPTADGVVNVLPYLGRQLSADPDPDDDGVIDDSEFDDSPAIAKAIECAASSTPPATVFFPPGRYVLRSPLRPQHDNLTLEGPELSPSAAAGDPDTATLVAMPCDPERYPGVVQISKLTALPQEVVVSGVSIRNFQIELTHGPMKQSNSGIRISGCANCTVENIIMRHAPWDLWKGSCKPPNLDGIVFSGGSGGTIRNVIVDGVPKAGIYLSSIPGFHLTPPITVENCEVKNINGPVGASGIQIITANADVRNCEVHHNHIHPATNAFVYGGHGLFIGAQLPPSNSTLPPTVPQHVTVEDSYFHHNRGSGIYLGSVVDEEIPEDINFFGVKSAYNGAHGVHVTAGTGVLLQDVWSWGNQYTGMYFSSQGTMPATARRVEQVTVEEPIVFNNQRRTTPLSLPGIHVQASNVTIEGGTIAHCDPPEEIDPPPTSDPPPGRQTQSIQEQCWQTGSVTFHPQNNDFVDIDIVGASAPGLSPCPYP